MNTPCRGIAAIFLALCSLSAFAQSEVESRTAPPVYAETGQYIDSYADDSSSVDQNDSDSAPYHGDWSQCCRRRDQEEQPTSIPRSGPEYEYQNIGEPWDSHARLRRAQNETKDAQAEVDRTGKAHYNASHELEVAEMWYDAHPRQEDFDEFAYEEQNEYEHTSYEQRRAWERYDNAYAEEEAAQTAADSADADYKHWSEQQPKPDYSRPYVTELPNDEDSDVLSKDELFTMLENSSRDDFYKALREHADGTGTIEDVEAAYAQLVEWRR